MDVSEEGYGEVDKEVIRTLAFDDQVVLGEGLDLGVVGGGSLGGRADGGGAGKYEQNKIVALKLPALDFR